MKAIAIKLIERLSPHYEGYAVLIWKNRLKNLFKSRDEHKYLFVLSPPYCGSTLLTQLIFTADAVSVNNQRGTREGQKLPTVRAIMCEHNRRWDDSLDFDWNLIKKEWRKYWNLDAGVLLEKSPPNIIRAKSIEACFEPAYFIVFHRNPYAHCESLLRRTKRDANSAAIFAIQCLTYQRDNATSLERSIQLSYEDLTNDPAGTVTRLARFLPELADINHTKKFPAHNYLKKTMKIKNLNDDKISKLTAAQLQKINHVFAKNKDVLDFFNYAML